MIQLQASQEEMKSTSFPHAAHKVRRILRRFSLESIIDVSHKKINEFDWKTHVFYPKVKTWLYLLVVKLALEDRCISLHAGERANENQIAYCVEILWNAQINLDFFGGNDPKDHPYRMRSMINVQIHLQAKPSLSFLRWPALVMGSKNQKTKDHFDETFEMSPLVYALLCYVFTNIASKQDKIFSEAQMQGVKSKFPREFGKFVSLFSRDVYSLRAELVSELHARLKNNQPARSSVEIFEIPWLKRYPFLSAGHRIHAPWSPTLLSLGIEENAHNQMVKEMGQQYTSNFSLYEFEAYVIELIEEICLPYVSESNYKDAFGSDKTTVEAISTDGISNLFIEAKLAVFDDKGLSGASSRSGWAFFKPIKESFGKGWGVGERLRSNECPDHLKKFSLPSSDFLIVVVNKQINCPTGSAFYELFGDDLFTDNTRFGKVVSRPTPAQIRRMPLHHVLIMSIQEFEHLSMGVIEGRIEIFDFVRKVSALQLSKPDVRMTIREYLDDYKIVRRLPSRMQSMLCEVRGELWKILGDGGPTPPCELR